MTHLERVPPTIKQRVIVGVISQRHMDSKDESSTSVFEQVVEKEHEDPKLVKIAKIV